MVTGEGGSGCDRGGHAHVRAAFGSDPGCRGSSKVVDVRRETILPQAPWCCLVQKLDLRDVEQGGLPSQTQGERTLTVAMVFPEARPQTCISVTEQKRLTTYLRNLYQTLYPLEQKEPEQTPASSFTHLLHLLHINTESDRVGPSRQI